MINLLLSNIIFWSPRFQVLAHITLKFYFKIRVHSPGIGSNIYKIFIQISFNLIEILLFY
jgi:hypothetical protein